MKSFVVEIQVETAAGETGTDYKVFQLLEDAFTRWFMAWEASEEKRQVTPKTRYVLGCALYDVPTSDPREAVRLVKRGEGTLIRSDEKPYGEWPDIELDLSDFTGEPTPE